MKSFLRQGRVPGAEVTTIVMRERKYDAAVALEPLPDTECEHTRRVDLVLEAEPRGDEVVDDDLFVFGHVRNVARLDREDDDVAVQGVVVFDVGPHGERRRLLARVEEYGSSG
jgi:hypothetical protein